MVNVNDVTITSLETISAFDVVTGAYKFSIDELQSAKIANTQEKQDVTGKGGRKLNSLKKNKAVVVSGTNGLMSGGLMETQVGSSFVNKAAKVMVPEYLTVNNSLEATTTYKAVGTSGNEIETVYVRNSDGTLGEALEQAATAASGKFAYAPATKKLTFDSGDVEEGSEIAVFYKRQVQADVLENMSDKYSEKLCLYIDAFAEDKCGNIYRVQFCIPKADFNGNFDFDMGGDQTVHAFEAESLTGACGASASLWTYTIFGKDAADAE